MSDKPPASVEGEEGASASSSSGSEQQQQSPTPRHESEVDNSDWGAAPQHKAEGDDRGISDNSSSSEESAGSNLSTMDRLQQMMAQYLHLGGEKEKEDIPKLLKEVTLEGVARYISGGKCKNIVTMVGAGISTSAGIPDFRSPGSGLYDNLQQYNLPRPEAIFDIGFFMENPKPFFVLAKELFPGSLKPTVCHYFIRMLYTKGLLLRHFTQNIDTLERVAGLPEDKLVEAHGTFHTSHCLECRAEYTLPWMKERVFADEIPKCSKEDCTGVVKPDIVFFGESLPDRFSNCVEKDLKHCDLLIVMGTSLAVHPFASLVNRVPVSTPRLYINLEKPPRGDNLLSLLMGRGSSFRFDAEDNYRDVFQQVTCDDGCSILADLLGWGDELRKLVKEDHARIDAQTPSQEGGKQGGEAAAL